MLKKNHYNLHFFFIFFQYCHLAVFMENVLIYNGKINHMRKYTLFSLTIISAMLLTSCDAIATIFEAGMWWGIILVVGIIGLIFWLFTRGRKG